MNKILTVLPGQDLKTTGKFNFKTPLVYALPLSDYTDEMERKRDRQWYLKMKQLEKKSQVLKEELELMLKTHVARVLQTKEIIAFSNQVLGRSMEEDLQ